MGFTRENMSTPLFSKHFKELLRTFSTRFHKPYLSLAVHLLPPFKNIGHPFTDPAHVKFGPGHVIDNTAMVIVQDKASTCIG